MLTADLLQERLIEWSKKAQTLIPRPIRSPIILYQLIFALVHDLKTSVQLSTDSTVHAYTSTVIEMDDILRRLAYGEIELSAAENEKLYSLITHLDQLESLEMYLRSAVQIANTVSEERISILDKPYPWDGLANARAHSCHRHGYVFYEKPDTVKLAELPSHDARTQEELAASGSILVARSMEPKPQGAELILELRQLIAEPKA